MGGNLKLDSVVKKQSDIQYEYSPHAIEVSFDDITILKVGAPALPMSALPIGTQTEEFETKVIKRDIDESLINHVCSISYCNEDLSNQFEVDSEEFVETNSAGYVVIQSVDMERQFLTLLSPNPGSLPSRNLLLMEDVVYVDK